MVTSNSIYYASGFSSLYIPKDFIPLKPGQLNDQARMVLSKVTEKYKRNKYHEVNYCYGEGESL